MCQKRRPNRHGTIEMHHFGSGICNQIRCRTGNIFMTTRPATIRRSHCRGLNRMTSAPKRARSCREAAVAISSIPQQAVANGIGHMLLERRPSLPLHPTLSEIRFPGDLPPSKYSLPPSINPCQCKSCHEHKHDSKHRIPQFGRDSKFTIGTYCPWVQNRSSTSKTRNRIATR